MGNNTKIGMLYEGMEQAAERLRASAGEANEAILQLNTAMQAALEALQGQAAFQLMATWPVLNMNGLLISAELLKMADKMDTCSMYVQAEDANMARVIYFTENIDADVPDDVVGGGEV